LAVKTPAEMKLNKTLLDSAVNFALNNENKVERFTNCQPKILCERDQIKNSGTDGGPAGVILKNGYISTMGDIHRVDMTFSVTKVFFYNNRIGNRQRSYKKV
jgi:hypothetical protein